MNTRYTKTPEIIGTVTTIDKNGNDEYVGDRVVGISAKKSERGVGSISLDIRDIEKESCIQVSVELTEILSAIGQATLNATAE